MLLEKIQKLAELIEKETKERLIKAGLGCEANLINAQTHVKQGNKYVKINIGTSGKLMIDNEGNIFGIKGYNVINKAHFYGTLETINDYY